VFSGPFGVIEGPNARLRDATSSVRGSDPRFESAPPRRFFG
jgi:hypothetical protein